MVDEVMFCFPFFESIASIVLFSISIFDSRLTIHASFRFTIFRNVTSTSIIPSGMTRSFE